MRATPALLLLLLLLTLQLAALAQEEQGEGEVIEDQDLLRRQLGILKLLVRVHQKNLFDDIAEVASNFTLEADNYELDDVVPAFTDCRDNGALLERGKPFSVYYPEHLQQLKYVINLLFYARDFDVFFQTAAYLRDRVNEVQFVFALTVATLLREDTQDIILPPPSEIFPELFVTSDVIQRAYEARLLGLGSSEDEPHVIYANYTGYPEAKTREGLVSYFTEDVGLNSFFAYLNYRYPFFLDAANYSIANGPRRGEIFYFTRQQLLARFQLERLSNKLDSVEPVDYYGPVKTGFYPGLRLQCGKEAPARPVGLSIREDDVITLMNLKNFEYRLREAVDLGLVIHRDEGRRSLFEENPVNTLGNMIEGSENSVYRRYYGSFYREILGAFGQIMDPLKHFGVAPSILEQFETVLRDPLYYEILQRILSVFYQFQRYLPFRSEEDLTAPGLNVTSLRVSGPLTTFFEYGDVSLANAIHVPSAEDLLDVNIVARLPRLNHDPFEVRVTVSSDNASTCLVRLFLGPRHDALGRVLGIEESRHDFFEIDRFLYDLEEGENVIVRSSLSSPLNGTDPPSFRALLRDVSAALEGNGTFRLPPPTARLRAFPRRLLLPRGSRLGLTLRLLAVVSPALDDFLRDEEPDYYFRASDGLPLGFPFDRQVLEVTLRATPNVRFTNVVVVHRQGDQVDLPEV